MLVYFCHHCDCISLAERVEEPWILLAELEDTGFLFKGLVSQDPGWCGNMHFNNVQSSGYTLYRVVFVFV